MDRFGQNEIQSHSRINPEFLENWEALHEEANARRKAADAGRKALRHRYPDISEEERKELHQFDTAWKEAHEQCLRCLNVHQHRTFEDALAWLNQNFSNDNPIELSDNSKFETVREQIIAAYEIYSSRRK